MSREYREVEEETPQLRKTLVSVTCDICKASFSPQVDLFEFSNIFNIDFIAGYGSIFGDGTRVTADFCEDCFKSKLGEYLSTIPESEYFEKELSWDQKIIRKHPRLFQPDPALRNNLMSFGFECDEGWKKILTELCNDLERQKLSKAFQILQVKEKFGTLRFYVSGGTGEVFALIDAAERASSWTCEVCGETFGAARTDIGGWLKTLCPSCMLAERKSREEEDEREKNNEVR